jgi:hypothetical protein
MNDHERFTGQMNETLEILRKAIENLDAPLVQKDKLAGLIRNLRDFAYQAERAEVRNEPTAPGGPFRYPNEFGDSITVEPEIRQLVLDGLMTDESWHNNSAAHFERCLSDRNVLLLFIAEEDQAERADENMPRNAVKLVTKQGTADAHREQF